jgi:hypothetical protein
MSSGKGSFIGQDGLNAPDKPTGVTVSGGADGVASISFIAPSDTGTSAITGFVATASTGVGATGTSSPISVTGLTLGTAATFRAYAINAYGTSAASDATSAITPAGSRGVFSGGSTADTTIDYISITSTGNATDFGDHTATSYLSGGLASSTRGVFILGSNSNIIEFITISTTGNATDFGDTGTAGYWMTAFSNSTRGVHRIGYNGSSNLDTIEYITIASAGNSTDFGNISSAGRDEGGLASPTRGVLGGMRNNSNDATDEIQYVTIASTGNTTDFGNLTVARYATTGASNSTRGLFIAGSDGNHNNVVDYISIASTGNATDFGDTSTGAQNGVGALANSTRAVNAGGERPSSRSNVIEYFTISSAGNGTDFGDLTVAKDGISGLSNAHGGL